MQDKFDRNRNLKPVMWGLGLLAILLISSNFLCSMVHEENIEPPDKDISYLRTINISNSTQLITALTNAEPGDDIVLGNGKYNGNFILTKNGTSENPIRIRSANPQKATLTGRLSLEGKWGIAYQIRMEGQNAEIETSAEDTRVLRCLLENTGFRSIDIRPGSLRTEIAFNEIRNYGGNERFGRGISVELTTESNSPKEIWIHHNYIVNQSLNAGGAAINIGSQDNTSEQNTGCIIEYNLVENASRDSNIATKSSNIIVRFNTYRHTDNRPRNSRMQCRNGNNNQWIGNSSFGGGGPIMYGDNHMVVGNFRDETSGTGPWYDIGAGAGTRYGVTVGEPGMTHYAACRNCTFIGNIPKVRVGSGLSTAQYPALSTIVEGSPFELIPGKETETTTSPTASIEVPAYVVLWPKDVGPEAEL